MKLPKDIIFDTTLLDKLSMIGKVFNKLECLQVVGYRQEKDSKRIIYSFKCECGNLHLSIAKDVVAGKIKSCGCIHAESSKKMGMANKKTTDESAFSRYYRQYKSAAKKRGLEFSLEEDEFRTITSSNCHYCNEIPSKKYCGDRKRIDIPYLCNGVDRVDNTLGYTVANSVPACSMCNYAKKDNTYLEFKNWLARFK